MNNHETNTHDTGSGEVRADRGWKGAAVMVAIIVGFYVLREHWGHVLGIAPYLLLLACPLMHVFMHGKHAAHGHHEEHHEPGTRANS